MGRKKVPDKQRSDASEKRSNPYLLWFLGLLATIIAAYVAAEHKRSNDQLDLVRKDAHVYVDTLGQHFAYLLVKWQLAAVAIERGAPRDSVIRLYEDYADTYERMLPHLQIAPASLCDRFGETITDGFQQRVLPAVANLVDTLRIRTRRNAEYRQQFETAPLVVQIGPARDAVNRFLLDGWRFADTARARFEHGECYSVANGSSMPVPSVAPGSGFYREVLKDESLSDDERKSYEAALARALGEERSWEAAREAERKRIQEFGRSGTVR